MGPPGQRNLEVVGLDNSLQPLLQYLSRAGLIESSSRASLFY
jgi:hypothetical protein